MWEKGCLRQSCGFRTATPIVFWEAVWFQEYFLRRRVRRKKRREDRIHVEEDEDDGGRLYTRLSITSICPR